MIEELQSVFLVQLCPFLDRAMWPTITVHNSLIDTRFLIYKLPKYKINESVGTGLDYMYLDPTLPSWQRSTFLVNDSQGALWYTLGQLYQDHKSKSNTSAYLLYNDDPPLLDYKKNHGHTKGVVHFDMEQGFWLSHSVPRFPPFPERGYGWPPTGKRNGQTALCVTYRGSQFVSIAEQLLLYNPRVYNCSLPDFFMPMFSNLSILCQGVRLPSSDKKQATKLMSSRGETFVNFAKSQYYVDDIYTAWVAQDLKSNLLTETWQEKEHELPPNCSLPEHVYNVKRIQLPGPHFFYSQFILYKLPKMNKSSGLNYLYMDASTNAIQLQYIHPFTFNYDLPKTFPLELRCVAQRECYPKTAPWSRQLKMMSAGGNTFVSFVKYLQFKDDLYSGLLVEPLGDDLFAKGWGRLHSPLPSNCSMKHNVYNIITVNLPKVTPFKTTFDHSKWCVTKGASGRDPWTCIADLNREKVTGVIVVDHGCDLTLWSCWSSPSSPVVMSSGSNQNNEFTSMNNLTGRGAQS
ncbi:DNS2B protein, partial [Polypterus senegalus]